MMDDEEDFSSETVVNYQLYIDQMSKAEEPWQPDIKMRAAIAGPTIVPGQTYYGGCGEVWSFAEDTAEESKLIGRTLKTPWPYPSDYW